MDCPQKHRVVIIHPSAGVNWSGGTENFSIEITRYLRQYFDIELLGGHPQIPCFFPSGGIPRTEAAEMLHSVQPIEALLRKFSTNPDIVIEHITSFVPCVSRLLKKPADLIFPCNGYGGLAAASFVRLLLGTPILYKSHTGMLGGGKRLALDLKFQPDHLVTFSKEIEEFAKKVRPKQAISIIPNGVDTQKFNSQGERLSLSLPKPTVLCVASLNRKGHKRVELAIKAVSQLPNASLLVCGDGVDRDYYQALGEDLLGSSRFSIRTFPFDQMPTVYRSADVFTLPSLNEPFGNVFVQALACGLPIVATDDELRRFIVGDAGVLCDVTDLDSYANSIDQALKGSFKDKALENSRRFSWETVAKSYRDLILSMIKS